MTLNKVKTTAGLTLVLGTFISFHFFDFLSNHLKAVVLLAFGIGVLLLASKKDFKQSFGENQDPHISFPVERDSNED